MASTSTAAAGATSSHATMKKYDVFISFRGEDTRHNFTSHLHSALLRHKIETYIDYRLEKGDDVWPTLVQAIHDSSVSLVIFSENYASSTWCLNELNEIMECKKNKGHDVIPVFYKIDPSQVRKQKGSYKTAFGKYEENDFKQSNKWRETLFEAANISGFDSAACRTESDLIEEIIKSISKKIDRKQSNKERGHLILDQNYAQVKSLLRTKSRVEVRIIGLWGMGGIGKTTIATTIFLEVSSQYDGTCFLANVREKSKRHGLDYIYSRLFSELLREDLHIDTPEVIPPFVICRLRRKKVFIVLDDVNSSELIQNLVGVRHDWLGAGSRVIVTTRDKHVLISGGVDKIHEVKEMSLRNSLQFFSLNAFKKIQPGNGYEELTKKAVFYAKGIPLVLKVLGSLLYSKSKNEWESALAKLKKFPIAETQEVLRLSYNELDYTGKEIFLDIACFFKGKPRHIVSRVLNACGFFADIGIRSLIDKALITYDVYDNCIEMHDLIQEMGHEIARSESINNPGQRRRLWDSEEVCDVLANNRGTDAVESIFLDTSQITNLHLCCDAIRKMSNLRLLDFNKGNNSYNSPLNSMTISMDIELPNKLIYIRWDEYPLKSLPSNCCWEKLVDLSMPFSNVEKLWNGVQKLPNLKNIDLSGSECLRECPNLSGSPNLESLSLEDCIMLTHVDTSIFSLQKLVQLNVNNCKELKSLCSNTCSPSLRRLYAGGCTNLQEFSLIILSDPCKTQLHFYTSGLDKVPSSILHLRNLAAFSFPICESLKDLPENFANNIVLWGSKKHECDAFITLRTILYSPAFWTLKYLQLYCVHSELPGNIWLLSSLESLSLRRSNIISLPETIKYLPRLEILDVSKCKMLQSVPMLPQSIRNFYARDCISLKTVVCSKTPPSKKGECRFIFQNCLNLDPDAYNNIVKEAITRIQHGENSLSEENEFWLENGKIFYLLPARSSEVGECFRYCSKQASITVDLPPNSKILTFVFYFILSQVHSGHKDEPLSFGCECSLQKSLGERHDVTSLFMKEVLFEKIRLYKTMSDHVFYWYDAQCCKEITEVTKERKATNDGITTCNANLTFKFFVRNKDNEELPLIKECGVWWIYPSEDQSVEEERICKCKRSREIYESHELIEMAQLTKKLKQCVFETPSDQDTEEVEDLRFFLERHLHISKDLN